MADTEVERACSAGVLCRLTCVGDDGSSSVHTWKAWFASGGLRWELRRVVPSLGLDALKTSLSRTLSDMWPRMGAALIDLGFDLGAHMGKSRRQLQSKGEDDSGWASAEQERWVSTEGLLAILLRWSTPEGRKQRSQREQALLLANSLVEQCCLPEAATAVLQDLPTAGVLQSCAEHPVENGKCCHVLRAEAVQARDGKSPQRRLVAFVLALASQRACAASQAFAKSLITRLAAAVLENADKWADFSWHKTSAADLKGPANKRRRVDPHIRSYALHGAAARGEVVVTALQGARLVEAGNSKRGHAWLVQECAALQAECHLRFRRAGALALAFDASRIGRPAKEMLATVATDLRQLQHTVLAPQVLRDWHPNLEKLPKLSAEDQQLYKEGSMALLRAHLRNQVDKDDEELLVDFRNKFAALEERRRKVDNAMVRTLGYGLGEFLPKRAPAPLVEGQSRYMANISPPGSAINIVRSCVIDEQGHRFVEAPVTSRQGEREYPVLHLCHDQGSVGLSASTWMVQGLRLRATVVWDLFHRLTNDVTLAQTDCGLLVLKLECLQACKMRQGPFDSQSFHQMLQASAKEYFSTLTPSNMLFQPMFDELAQEAGLGADSDYDDKDHEQKVWSYCMERLCHGGSYASAKTSRWWSFEQQSREALKHTASDFMLLIYIGYKRQWWKNISDSPLHSVSCPAVDHSDAAEFAGEADGGGAGNAEVEPGAPTVERLSLSRSRALVRERRAKCSSTLHFVAKLYGKTLPMKLWRVLAWLPTPLETAFSEMVERVKTMKGVLQLHTDLATGGILRVCLQIGDYLTSRDFAENLAIMNPAYMTDHEKHELKVTLDCTLKFFVATVGHLSLTSLQYAMPPLKFLALNSRDREVQKEALADLQRGWAALLQLEADGLQVPEAAKALDAMLVSRQVFAREQLIRMEEAGFDLDKIPSEVRKDIEEYGTSHLTSLAVEEVFNSTRRASSTNRSGKMSPQHMWHAAASPNGTMSEFGRPVVDITQAARSVAAAKLPCSVFDPPAGTETTLPEEMFDSFTAAKTEWPTASPETIKSAASAWQCCLRFKGQWARMTNHWMNMLAQPGTLLYARDTKLTKLILHRDQWGVIAWRTPAFVKSDGEHHLELAQGAKFIEHISIESYTNYKVGECDLTLAVNTKAGPPKIVIRFLGKTTTLLKYSAMCGFRGLTCPQLRKLIAHMELDMSSGKRPKTEVELVSFLFQQVMGDSATEEKLKVAMKERHEKLSVPEDVVKTTEIFKTDMEKIISDDIAGDEEVEQAYAEIKEKKLEHERREQKRLVEMAAWAAKASSSSASSSSSSAAARREGGRKFYPLPPSGMSAAEANEMVAPGARLSKDDRRENRWRLRSPHIQGEKSKSFGKASSTNDQQAMTSLIAMSWTAYTKATGMPCPHTFEGQAL